MDNKKTYYTAADYSRYHRGEMSTVEMHEMEKAALQDPFIQDALDGYVHTSTGEEDMKLLRSRLANVEKNDFSSTHNKFRNWWKIAAIFIVAAAVSFLVYNANNTNVVPTLAETKTSELPLADSEINTEITQASPSTNSDYPKITDGIGEQGDEIVILTKPEAKPVVKNIGKDIVETKAVEKIGQNYKVDGTVVTNEGLPVNDAKILSEDKKLLAKTDDQGKFEIESKNADLSTTIVTDGYQQRKKTLDANQTSTVVLREQVQMSNAPNNAAKTKAPVIAEATVPTTAYPINGWDDYNSYLKESTAIVYNEAGVKQSGTVILKFEIDRMGNPEKIVVKKSDCLDCNLAAIQVLKDGPKWMGKSAVINEISIKF